MPSGAGAPQGLRSPPDGSATIVGESLSGRTNVTTIRLGTSDDLPHLAQIEEAAATVFSDADLPPDLAQPVAQEDLLASVAAGILWVVEEDNGEVVGFVACEQIDNYLHISEMDVLPRHARKGLGSTLLRQVISYASAHPQVQFLTLTTFRHLLWNAPFYAKHGFVTLAAGGGIKHLERALSGEAARGLNNRVAMAKGVRSIAELR